MWYDMFYIMATTYQAIIPATKTLNKHKYRLHYGNKSTLEKPLPDQNNPFYFKNLQGGKGGE